MPNTKKFLDANGVAYLASLLDNYPDNDLLGTVINAIQDALDNKADITDLVEAETMANVTAMLTGFGLDTSTTLTPALAGSAETDNAVVQKGVSS